MTSMQLVVGEFAPPGILSKNMIEDVPYFLDDHLNGKYKVEARRNPVFVRFADKIFAFCYHAEHGNGIVMYADPVSDVDKRRFIPVPQGTKITITLSS